MGGAAVQHRLRAIRFSDELGVFQTAVHVQNILNVIESAKNKFEKEHAQKSVAKLLATDAMGILALVS